LLLLLIVISISLFSPLTTDPGPEDVITILSSEKELPFLIKENKTKAPSKLKVGDRYKWDAWHKLGKISKEEAMKTYV
jgi:hypothetical protein